MGNAFENNIAVAGKVLPSLHTAVWDELSNDWQNHRTETLTKVGVAAGLGVGIGVLCSRAPVLGREIMAVLGATELTRITGSSIKLIQMAAQADTEQQRDAVANYARKGIASEGALLVETLPGALIGGTAGAQISRRYGIGASLASMGQSAEAWQRGAFGDAFTFRGPGARTVSAAGENGGIDLLKLGGNLNESFAGTSTTFGGRTLEQARIWKVGAESTGDVKVSQTIMGNVRAEGISSAQEVSLGQRAANVSHPHVDGDIMLSTGDFNAVKEGGLVVAHVDDGAILVFGNGKGGLGNVHSTWNSLVTQPESGVALRVTSKWNPQLGLEPLAVQPVEWAHAERMLRGYRGGPLPIESLTLAPHVTAQSAVARAMMDRILASVRVPGT